MALTPKGSFQPKQMDQEREKLSYSHIGPKVDTNLAAARAAYALEAKGRLAETTPAAPATAGSLSPEHGAGDVTPTNPNSPYKKCQRLQHQAAVELDEHGHDVGFGADCKGSFGADSEPQAAGSLLPSPRLGADFQESFHDAVD